MITAWVGDTVVAGSTSVVAVVMIVFVGRCGGFSSIAFCLRS